MPYLVVLTGLLGTKVAGRNLAIILEVAALNHRLREFGIHSAQNLNEGIIATMLSATSESTVDE